MRYRLRTLLIVIALGPIVLALAFWFWQRYTGLPENFLVTEQWIETKNGWKRIYPPEPARAP